MDTWLKYDKNWLVIFYFFSIKEIEIKPTNKKKSTTSKCNLKNK